MDEDDQDFNRSLLGRSPSMYGVPVGRDSSYRPWHFVLFALTIAVVALVLFLVVDASRPMRPSPPTYPTLQFPTLPLDTPP